MKTPTPKTLLWEAVLEFGSACSRIELPVEKQADERVACLDRIADCIEALEREADLAEISHRDPQDVRALKGVWNSDELEGQFDG